MFLTYYFFSKNVLYLEKSGTKEGMGWDAPIKSYPDSPMIIKYAQVFKFYTNKCDYINDLLFKIKAVDQVLEGICLNATFQLHPVAISSSLIGIRLKRNHAGVNFLFVSF